MDKTKLFIVWLSGYLEACGPKLTAEQTKTIKNKLNNLFEHETNEPTIQEIGKKHGFKVHDEVPNYNLPWDKLYRC